MVARTKKKKVAGSKAAPAKKTACDACRSEFVPGLGRRIYIPCPAHQAQALDPLFEVRP